MCDEIASEAYVLGMFRAMSSDSCNLFNVHPDDMSPELESLQGFLAYCQGFTKGLRMIGRLPIVEVKYLTFNNVKPREQRHYQMPEWVTQWGSYV